MVTRAFGSLFTFGIFLGFGAAAAVLHFYEKWAWKVTAEALTWGKE